jgi:hypothetical protein
MFPEFPVNSYRSNDIDTIVETIRDLLNNHNSGINRILIENDEFGDVMPVCNPQAEMNLDANK